MSVITPKPQPWSPRRVATTIGVITALHLWAITHFNPLPATPPAPPPHRTAFRYFPGNLAQPVLASRFLTSDPAQFDEPTPGGFTGPTWRAVSQTDYRIPVWNEPPRFLALDPSTLGRALSGFLQGKGFPTFDVLPKEEPTPGVLGLYIPPELPIAQSHFRVEGEAGRFELAAQPGIPVWPSPDILPNSRVRISVNEQGLVTRAVLSERSSFAPANNAALQIARNLRFQVNRAHRPVTQPDSDLAIPGTAVFQWASVPATNSPVAHSSP